MRLGWLSPKWMTMLLRSVALSGLGLLSPIRGVTEMLLAPYLHLNHPQQWQAELVRIQALPRAELDQLVLVFSVCIGLNILHLFLCQRLVAYGSERLKQAFAPGKTSTV